MSINICENTGNSNNRPSDFALMITKILYSISVLCLASLFAVSLFDIRNYIEDHNSTFEYFDLLVLLGFIFFYYAPWMITVVLSQKSKGGLKCPWKISIVTSILYAFSVWYLVISTWNFGNNIQKELFSESLAFYLLYMFLVNILLSLNDIIETAIENSIDTRIVPIIFRSPINE